MRVLILGGTGAMGVSLVQILAENPMNDIYVTSRRARTSSKNVHYIQGNAHDICFLRDVLSDKYDVVIDFMVYTVDEFVDRVELLLSSTMQYVFLSSSRVYANSGEDKIIEQSPRLLDVCDDKTYIATDDYALTKAREEDILTSSKFTNWTIIRPYITYNDERLQLGFLEKEYWLYRALNHQTIVFPKDIAEKYTTLTYGYDVAKVIAQLLDTPKSLGQIFHIASEQTIKWKDVLEIYLDVLENELGYRPKVYMLDNLNEIGRTFNCSYTIFYDRLYNRTFSNEKVNRTLGYTVCYTDVREGLTKCLTSFIHKNMNVIDKNMGVRQAVYFDRITKEYTKLGCFSSVAKKIVYLFLRYIPIKF